MKIARFSCMIALVFLSACSKSDTKIEKGTYTGTFTVHYPNGNLFGAEDTVTGPVTVELQTNKKFESSGNTDKYPAGASGKYNYTKDKIIFENRSLYPANFDGNLVLNGEYDFVKTGNKLKFYKQNSLGYYEYDLMKQ